MEASLQFDNQLTSILYLWRAKISLPVVLLLIPTVISQTSLSVLYLWGNSGKVSPRCFGRLRNQMCGRGGAPGVVKSKMIPGSDDLRLSLTTLMPNGSPAQKLTPKIRGDTWPGCNKIQDVGDSVDS